MPARLTSLLAVTAALTTSAPMLAAPPTAEQVRFFESSIRPLLVEHCQGCHGVKKQWASLRLDSRDALLRGGDTGPAIVVGKPEESLLIKAVRQIDENLQMPPEGKLTDREIADLARWIKEGAAFPDQGTASKERTRDPNHWAFHRQADVAIPAVSAADWIQTPVDSFILARLEAAGITPAPVADRRTLIRRVTFDLTGLPPTPEDVDEFVQDGRPDAWARVVDRLLASPAYGERWGRHWLDVVRYADSNGLDENVCHGNAWRYRDYVVAAFNADKPFNEFIAEQIAGDLLTTTDPLLRNERLTATGFLTLGPKVLAEVDETKMEMDIVDEQIDTFGRAFLGMTFGCARCHDHKFDPIATADYYGLAGIFRSTKSMDSFKKIARWHENPVPTKESEAIQAAFAARVAEKKAGVQKFVEQADAAVKAARQGENLPEKLESLYPDATKAELKKLRDDLAAMEKAAPEIPSAMGAVDGTPVDVAIHIRGNHLKLGDVVPRHVPPVFSGPAPPQFGKESSGRLDLARWLTDPQHPLTARVIVNRVWRWHFGTGLVSSTDNFGLLGSPPTHPELLDRLAHDFTSPPAPPGGILSDEAPAAWSLKRLHRTILHSATYQQSSQTSLEAIQRDPENRLYGRAPVRRLEAEAVRDSLIAVSGRLDRTFGGTLLTHVKNRGYFFDHTSKDLTDYTTFRRSIYLPVVRNNVYDVFQLLDFPDPAVSTSDRASTTVAPQALLMLNSDLVAQSSADLAARIQREAGDDETARLQRLHRLVYGRDATEAEVAGLRQMRSTVEAALSAILADAAARSTQSWEAVCRVLLASNEFLYVR